MTDTTEYTNGCACGWKVTGPLDDVVEATIDHGRRIHNMEATREQVIAAVTGPPASDGATEISA
jgi:predicted small metal-binding protein